MSQSSSANATHLGKLEPMVERRLATLSREAIVDRIWARDPSVWGGKAGTPELTNRLAWLDVADRTLEQLGGYRRIAEDARPRFDRVVLCGMGGSSLAPEVLHRLCASAGGVPSFTMLDSTSPTAIALAENGDIDRTLFLVSSKSGTTLETMSLFRYFWQRTNGVGEQFVAITDPGTSLEQLAKVNGFRAVVPGEPEVGGRFSALSAFGMLPAALLGADVGRIIRSARTAMRVCQRSDIDLAHGAWLGAVLGECALAGRDKLTVHVSPSLHSFGLWLEQLIAESTGKKGRGILPVVTRHLPEPKIVGDDRIFISVRLSEEPSGAASDLDALAAAGHPVLSVELSDGDAIGGEFFRWEFATAVAGAILAVNPFDQPDVAASKANTQDVLSNRTPVPNGAGADVITALLDAVPKGHYVALLAYVAPTEDNERRLEAVAQHLGRQLRVAVTTGFGPRYLHSTGQLHKGGPGTGHFLHIVEAGGGDVAIPEAPYGFRRLLEAQAIGDYQALQHLGRPSAFVHGLDRLEGALL